MANKVEMLYRLSDVSDPNIERIVYVGSSLKEVREKREDEEFIGALGLIDKPLAITLIRKEPASVARAGGKVCPHCNRALDDEGLTFDEVELHEHFEPGRREFPEQEEEEEIEENKKEEVVSIKAEDIGGPPSATEPPEAYTNTEPIDGSATFEEVEEDLGEPADLSMDAAQIPPPPQQSAFNQ